MAKYITEDIYVSAVKENCISYASAEDAANAPKVAQAPAEEPKIYLRYKQKSLNKLM